MIQHSNTGSVPQDGRFLSEVDSRALAHRIYAMAKGGGSTTLSVESEWTAITRWARNRVTLSADTRDDSIYIARSVHGASGATATNQSDDVAIEWAVRRAERLHYKQGEDLLAPLLERYPSEPWSLRPPIWSEATYALTPEVQADAMRALAQSCEKAGMLSAGTIHVSATGRGNFTDTPAIRDHVRYYPFTWVRYTVTVRTPDGSGSGWAGLDHHDWARIDATAITERALEKCLRSRNPVALEPGRYTAILEPQAVSDFVCAVLGGSWSMWRSPAESPDTGHMFLDHCDFDPENPLKPLCYSKIGQQVIDTRISVSEDPMDPALSYPPFWGENIYHPVDWITNGVLKNLWADREYALSELHEDKGLMSSGTIRMRVTGPTQSVDEMIKSTRRGILVTRFSNVQELDTKSALLSAYTRDGLWLIENGAISKAIKNFRVVELPWGIMNRIEALGEPERVYRPLIPGRQGPAIVPAMKVKDFSFTQMSNAV